MDDTADDNPFLDASATPATASSFRHPPPPRHHSVATAATAADTPGTGAADSSLLRLLHRPSSPSTLSQSAQFDDHTSSSSLPSHLLSELDHQAQLKTRAAAATATALDAFLQEGAAGDPQRDTLTGRLIRHWRNERTCPELLPFEFDLVEELAGLMTEQARA